MKKLAKYFIEFIKNKLYNYYRNKGKEKKKKVLQKVLDLYFQKCYNRITKGKRGNRYWLATADLLGCWEEKESA